MKDGRNGVTIDSSVENASKLQVENAAEGRYEVVAENEMGRCSAMTKLAIDYDSVAKAPGEIKEQQQQKEVPVETIKSPTTLKSPTELKSPPGIEEVSDIQKPEGNVYLFIEITVNLNACRNLRTFG